MTKTISLRERIALYALLTSLTAFSIDALLPALRTIGADLGAAPPLSTQHVVSLFVFGMVFGELLLGPLSDAMGRKRALLLGLAVYALGTVVAMLAGSLETVILGRFLQGIGVAGPKIATRAMVRDQFEGEAMARVMSFMFTLFILVPMLAPAAGQGLVAVTGWRGVFVAYLVMAGLAGLWLTLRQPETLAAEQRIPFRPRLLLRNGMRILACRRVTLLVLATGIGFGVQLLYLGTAADLFLDAYGIEAAFPLFFALFASSIGLSSFLNGRLVRRHGMEKLARLGFCGLGAAGLALTLTALIWSGRPPLALFMALGFAAFFTVGLVFGNLNAMAMRSLGQMAGLGASLVASLSSLVATLFAIALGAIYTGTTLALSIGFLLAGALGLLLTELAARSDDAPVEAIRA